MDNQEVAGGNVEQIVNQTSIKELTASQEVPVITKKSRDSKDRKKDDKSMEQVLKALNSLHTTEEKLAAMCKKYADTVDENRKLQLSLKQAEKRLISLQREKEQLQTEHSKAVLTRSRLESLCRELQRQSKAIKDESMLKIREEEEKRKEMSAKFQNTLAEVTSLIQQDNEKNAKLRDDNLEMAKKFKSVCDQYELRDQQVQKISKQMQLEMQLAEAKLAKVKMEMTAEKEILLRDKQQLILEVAELQAKIKDMQLIEHNLRSQITMYTDKYDDFQNALTKSNDVFEGFKGEMEKMSKKITKLEKETSSWRQRWEKSHQALLEMAADKQQRDAELQLANKQVAQLQKLCRTLQAERSSMLVQLKAVGNSPAVSSPVEKHADASLKTDEQSTAQNVLNSDCNASESTSNEEIACEEITAQSLHNGTVHHLETSPPVSSPSKLPESDDRQLPDACKDPNEQETSVECQDSKSTGEINGDSVDQTLSNVTANNDLVDSSIVQVPSELVSQSELLPNNLTSQDNAVITSTVPDLLPKVTNESTVISPSGNDTSQTGPQILPDIHTEPISSDIPPNVVPQVDILSGTNSNSEERVCNSSVGPPSLVEICQSITTAARQTVNDTFVSLVENVPDVLSGVVSPASPEAKDDPEVADNAASSDEKRKRKSGGKKRRK